MEPVKEYIVTEIKVAYNPKRQLADAPKIITSSDAAFYLLHGFNRDTMALTEQFVVMYLNRANKVIGMYHASSGGITGTVADPRIILATALKVAAVSLILAHNHPSGNLKPSRADEELTTKISQAGKFMDIKVVDHLILDPHGQYYSFADEGLM